MNLLEVQDRLNKLPPRPESIQYLTAASNGQNPQVPPYMALARISEINKQMQTAQNKPQPPAEPLNQSLPKQAMQSMGIGALPQGGPQQAVAQGMPQGAPQGAPQQAPQAPQAMAEGGLAGLPVDPRMFEYGSGGVIAFANPEGKQDVEDPDAEEDDDEDADVEVGAGAEASANYDPVAALEKLKPQIAAAMKQGVRPVRSRAAIEAELDSKKDYGVDEGPIGQKYLEGLGALQEANANERGIQGGDIDIRRKLAASKGLLDWSDASRGQTGMGGVGALGRNYISSTERFMKEEQALREEAIKDQSLINEAQYKVQALRQAQRSGDVKAEQKADVDLAKIAKDLGVSKNKLIQAAITGNLGVIGKQVMAKAQVDAAKERAKGKGAGGAGKQTDLDKSYKAELDDLLDKGYEDNAATRKKAMNNAQDRLSKSAGTARVDVSRVEKANAEFSNRMIDPSTKALRLKRNTDPAAYQAGIKALKEEIRKEFGVAPTEKAAGEDDAVPAAPAPAAPAPAAGPITPEAFQAKWAKLKPGQKLVGPDGVEYTKK
jgi:hypothetical protein